MRRIGTWRRAVVAVMVTIAVIELASYLILTVVGVVPDRSYRDMYRTSACLKSNEFNNQGLAMTAQEVEVLLNKIPHPFFGITVNPEGTTAEMRNATVGADFEKELRYRIQLGADPRSPDEFTIGIFGASVAGGFADYVMRDDSFAQRLHAAIPALKDKRIVIRNMAISSSRQPSQFAIATTYMELLDLTINLDGYSEVAVIEHPEYPIEFPMFADVFYSREGPSRYLRMRAAEELCRRVSALPEWLPGLAYSNAYYLLWYNLSQRINASLYGTPAPSGTKDQDVFSPDDVRELYARYYQKYTRYQHQVLSANGVRSYFFLQPNQYVEKSKTFSNEERSVALSYGDRDEIRDRYALLRQKIRELRAAGVPAFDLTPIFADVAETIYVDSCCHVNERGNQIIAERIADIIVKEENRRAADSQERPQTVP